MSYASPVTRGLLCLVLVACAPAPVSPHPTTAAEILRATAETYAHAKSYTDHGRQTMTMGKSSYSDAQSFETAFVRGGSFRFEYDDMGYADRSFVIWSDGTQTLLSRDTRPGPWRFASLGGALDAEAGFSSGTAYRIPKLLMPSLGGQAITRLDKATREADDVIGGVRCFRISGSVHRVIVTLWIDTNTYAIRQVRRRTRTTVPRVGPVDTDDITSYEPSFGGIVDSAQLEPPQARQADSQP